MTFHILRYLKLTFNEDTRFGRYKFATLKVNVRKSIAEKTFFSFTEL